MEWKPSELGVLLFYNMAKLGYTWYPKDWGNSESVFELTLVERGLYRELIDMAMLSDNKTLINIKTWARKFGSTESEIQLILDTLFKLNLIEYKKDVLFIPSCESRLNLVRGGSKGGKTSKPTIKPTPKPIESLLENNNKPISNQIEIENKVNINESFYKELLISESWIEINAKNNKIYPDKVKQYLTRFNNNLIAQGDKKNNKSEYQSHFARWLPIEIAKDNKEKPKFIPLI
jgi:hypothetical protein